jgi:hypothetical protein
LNSRKNHKRGFNAHLPRTDPKRAAWQKLPTPRDKMELD